MPTCSSMHDSFFYKFCQRYGYSFIQKNGFEVTAQQEMGRCDHTIGRQNGSMSREQRHRYGPLSVLELQCPREKQCSFGNMTTVTPLSVLHKHKTTFSFFIILPPVFSIDRCVLSPAMPAGCIENYTVYRIR